MKYNIHLVSDAEEDLFDIYRYTSERYSSSKAHSLIENIKNAILKLESYPAMGNIPPELERIAVSDFLEIHFKPYRIIYQLLGNDVFIHCVLDGRRDMQTLLQERLLID